MKSRIFAYLTFFLFCIPGYCTTYSLSSPDSRLKAEIVCDKHLTYSLTYDGKTIITPSEISMSLSNGLELGSTKVQRVKRSSHSGSINATFYRKAVIQDNYSEIILDFGKYSAVFRAYDEGFAWRWSVRKMSPYTVNRERASFDFPEDFKMFASYTHKYPKSLESQYMDDFENVYSHTEVSRWELDHMANLPLMVEANDGVKMVIAESDLLSYPGMFLYKGEGTSLDGRFAAYPSKEELGGHNMLQQMVIERENYLARCDGNSREYPWRIVCVSPNSMNMSDNDMVYRLASPCPENEDYSWVKPGKVAWDWLCAWNIRGVDFRPGINTETYKYFIDFASDNGIEYVILDEGWAVKYAGNLFEVVPEIDLPEIVSYAKNKDVGIILWAGYDAFRKDIDKVCSHYAAMGIKGFKVDFLNRDDQIISDFIYNTAKIAAKYKLLVDFHGTSKPTGLQRRFPNVINVEGIFGMEQMRNKTLPEFDMVEFDVTVPFVRFVAGFADYTQGAMRNASKKNHRAVKTEPMSQGTRCRQLAEYVIFDSPLSMLMDSPTNYMIEKDCLEFITKIPTVWDETKVIAGEVAEYIVLARRKGDVWYIGAMTDWTARDLEIDLSGIVKGPVTVDSYVDGMAADKFANDFRRLKYDASGTIKVHLAPGGGFAAKLTPRQEKDYPEWLDEAAIYHIYPSSFKDTDGDGYGDLEGIRRSLDYIARTGFNTIWLSPVFCSQWQDGGYDITDYYKVDPRFGDNSSLDALISDAHKKNIRVCLDLVAGHTSNKHPWFMESASADTTSKYRDYYIWTDGKDVMPPKPDRGGWVDNDYPRNGYYLMNYYDIQPALNYGFYQRDTSRPWEQSYDDPGPVAVREEMRKILAFWFDKGVDGFRCDMAWSLVKGDDAQFHGVRKLWEEMFSWQKANYPDRIFLSEWSSPIEAISCGFDIDIIRHNGCGKTMYRNLVHNTKRNVDTLTGKYPPKNCWFDKSGCGSMKDFVEPYTHMYETTRGHGYPCMPTSSHDTWRLNRNQRCTAEELKVAMTFFLTMPWVPIVYYGEEIGMRSMDGVKQIEGSRDRSAQRTPMQWNRGLNAGFSTCNPDSLYLPVDTLENRPDVETQLNDPSSLLNYTRELLSLRKTEKALANGTDWEFLSDVERPYPAVYRRSCGKSVCLVILNPSDKKVSATIRGNYDVKYLYGTRSECCKMQKSGDCTVFTIDGVSSAIFKIK